MPDAEAKRQTSLTIAQGAFFGMTTSPMRLILFLVVIVLTTFAATDSARAQINVPPGFAVDVLLNQIDGSTPRLEAISNPAFGFGVIAADITNGVLTVKRISQSSLDVLAVMGGGVQRSPRWRADCSI